MDERYIEVTVHRPGYAQRRAQKEHTERRKRRVCGILAAVSAVFLFGTVGGLEHDTLPLGTGTIYMAVSMAATVLFTWLAGGFDDEE